MHLLCNKVKVLYPWSGMKCSNIFLLDCLKGRLGWEPQVFQFDRGGNSQTSQSPPLAELPLEPPSSKLKPLLFPGHHCLLSTEGVFGSVDDLVHCTRNRHYMSLSPFLCKAEVCHFLQLFLIDFIYLPPSETIPNCLTHYQLV